MVLRSVIGALVAVGVMGAIAAALPERNAGHPTPAPPPAYGSLATPSAPPPAEASLDSSLDARNRQAALLKLASVQVTSDGIASRQQQFAPQPVAPPPRPAVAIVPPQPAPAPQPAPPAVRSIALTSAAPPPVASLPAASLPVKTEPAPIVDRANGRININRATIAQLDHIPGGGRIGAWIARRRPYRSIEDLLTKRVLREAAFQRIKNAITVD